MQVGNAPHRIPELWFEDGNIVIQAGNSQFRVHRGILAACSPVFKDMLLFPQPADAELVEGCPVVRLTDAPTEVTVFLKAIFVPDYFMPFPAKTEYTVVQGCFRLSHKYGVEHLRLLIHFSSPFRTTLSQRDKANYPYSEDLESTSPSSLPQSDIISWSVRGLPAGFSCIQLAREVDVPWILPIVFYTLSNSLSRRKSMLITEVLRGTIWNGVSTCLSVEDQGSFLSGHIRQIRFSTASILGSFSDPVGILGCMSPLECFKGRLSTINIMQQTISVHPSMPLDIGAKSDWESSNHDICISCLRWLQREHDRMREEFWNDLPKMYGLPPWEELEKLKVEAIGTQWFSES